MHGKARVPGRFLRPVDDGIFRIDVVVIGIDSLGSVRRRRIFREAQRRGFRGRRKDVLVGRVAFGFFPFQQRIALEFLLDESLQFEVRHLQKLDRLLQLRGHHKALALADFESLVQRHWKVIL